MSYRYDVFLSYNAHAGVKDWVEYHFFEALSQCLEAECNSSPQIYNYARREPGAKWPDEVKEALARSKLLVCIWTPRYFSSRWCIAEWKTMCARATNAGIDLEHLIYPIQYGDGNFYPSEARTQRQVDFRKWAIPIRSWADNPEYVQFRREVQKLAENLAARLELAPEWSRAWPFVEPEPEPEPILKLPRY
jgi:TIR domain